MKAMKKLLPLIVAVAFSMVAFTGIAFADNATHSITLADNDTHTYKIYQVLIGDIDGSVLSNAQWGADAKDSTADVKAFMDSLQGKSEAEVADLVKAQVGASATGRTTIGGEGNMTVEGLPTGYYVLVDETAVGSGDFVNDSKALHVVQLVNDIDALTIKWGTSSDNKTITADTLGKDEGTNDYNPGVNNDNVSIGDTVKYNISATVPDNADKFKEGTFFFVITDKLSSGLTFNDDIKVYDGETELAADKYTVQKDINGNTFEVALINAAQYKGKTINVKYSAVLNKDAVIGDEGNPNTSTVKFSNDPNKQYDGSPEDANHPGFPDSTKEVPTGETPQSQTITYTTGIEIQKVDENGEPLTGATFEISGQSAKMVVTKTESFVEDAAGTYYLLKNGTYTMVAPTEENTMVDAEAGATKGYVEDADATGDDVITIGDKKYRPYVPATDAGKHIYVLKEGSADAYASTTTKYKKVVTEKAVDSNVTDHKMSDTVDSNGLARFDGLGAGTYTIRETGTPSGYNTAPDATVTVSYNASGEAKFTVTGGTYEDGVVKIKVVNKKGTTLPSTGGMGTTILYIVGGVMIILFGAALIARRVARKQS